MRNKYSRIKRNGADDLIYALINDSTVCSVHASLHFNAVAVQF